MLREFVIPIYPNFKDADFPSRRNKGDQNTLQATLNYIWHKDHIVLCIEGKDAQKKQGSETNGHESWLPLGDLVQPFG